MEKPSKEAEQPPWIDQAPPRDVKAKNVHHPRPSQKPQDSGNTCRDTEACGKTRVSYRCISTIFHHIQSGFNSYNNSIKSAEKEVFVASEKPTAKKLYPRSYSRSAPRSPFLPSPPFPFPPTVDMTNTSPNLLHYCF